MTEGMRVTLKCAFLSLLVILLQVGFATAQTAGDSEKVTILLPKGNAKAGKQAFQELLCTACHRVSGENAFPKPVAGYEGPILGSDQAKQSTSDLITSILLPSHKMSKDLEERLRTATSPMTDYSDALTVRQLVNLVAYIHSIK